MAPLGVENRLVLGTAQLGLDYGVANRAGQPDARRAAAIVKEAWARGIREFDTAQAYGQSETVLGKALSEAGLLHQAQVISKFDPGLDHVHRGALKAAVQRSLTSLNVRRIRVMMLHDERLLALWKQGLADTLQELVESGAVEKIGVSVYTPAAARQALKTDGIEAVQLPMSILDRRFEQNGALDLARAQHKEIFIRSVFLQGLLLMPVDHIPAALASARPLIGELARCARKFQISRLTLALAGVKKLAPQCKIVVGAETPAQVTEICGAWPAELPDDIWPLLDGFSRGIDAHLLNPAKWSV